MKILIILIVIGLTGCAQTIPKTGNKSIDDVLATESLSYQTRMNIYRRYQGEEPVFKDKKPGIWENLTANKPPAGYARTSTSTSTYRPVVDPSVCLGCDYEQDLAQCQEISANNTNMTGNAMAGAAGGALTGAIIGAFLDVDAGHTAAMGATAGGLQGVGQELQTRNAMIARCMSGRGYSVLR